MTFWNAQDDWYTCLHCNANTSLIHGNQPILLLGDAPTGDKDDIAQSKILRYELAKVGLDLFSAKIGYLWYHKKNGNSECLERSKQHIFNTVLEQKIKAILLLDKEVTKELTGYNITEVSGCELQTDYFSIPVSVCYHPRIVFSSLGEFRLGLQKFAERVEKLNL